MRGGLGGEWLPHTAPLFKDTPGPPLRHPASRTCALTAISALRCFITVSASLRLRASAGGAASASWAFDTAVASDHHSQQQRHRPQQQRHASQHHYSPARRPSAQRSAFLCGGPPTSSTPCPAPRTPPFASPPPGWPRSAGSPGRRRPPPAPPRAPARPAGRKGWARSRGTGEGLRSGGGACVEALASLAVQQLANHESTAAQNITKQIHTSRRRQCRQKAKQEGARLEVALHRRLAGGQLGRGLERRLQLALGLGRLLAQLLRKRALGGQRLVGLRVIDCVR